MIRRIFKAALCLAAILNPHLVLCADDIIFADNFEARPLPARVYVLDSGVRNVAVISTETNTVIKNIRVGLRPADMVMTLDGAFIYVPNLLHDTVSIISTDTDEVIATLPVGVQPWRVVLTQSPLLQIRSLIVSRLVMSRQYWHSHLTV